MTSTTTRIISVALAMLAIAAPAATARSLDSYQDLRNPDQQAPAPQTYQDLRNPDQRNPDQRAPGVPSDLPQTMKPVVIEQPEPQPVADDGGPSPLVFIAPSLVLVAMFGAALVYTRSARHPARV
jgi:hypothetical protein